MNIKPLLAFVSSCTLLTSCAHEKSGDFSAYNPGLCYQPLYWPSECIQPDPPSAAEVSKARRAYYKKKREQSR